MSTFNFAEAYRATGLDADADTLKARQPAFQTVCDSVKDAKKWIELARLYFGVPTQDIEWFRKPFADADASFSMTGNASEVAALAVCLLEAVEQEIGTIAALTLWGFGTRQPVIRPDKLSDLNLANGTEAIRWRTRVPTVPDQIRPPAKDDASAAIDALAANQAFPQVVEALRKVNSDSQSFAKSLAQQTKGVAASLVAQMDVLQEQTQLLWWHIGGWSRITETPFSEMQIGAASIFAGLDMAALSRTWTGPIAASAILHRTIWHERSKNDELLSIASAIASIDPSALGLIRVSDSVRSYADICPVLTAIQKAQEMEGGSTWHSAFQKATALPVETTFSPTNLAIQVFREASVLEAVDQVKT